MPISAHPAPACPVCRGHEIVFGDVTAHAGREFRVHRCAACDLIFTAPAPTDAELEDYYAGEATADSGYSFEYLSNAHEGFLTTPPGYLRTTRDWLLSKTRNHFQSGNFLEIGCNLGLLSELLIPFSSMNHFGIELNPRAVAFCKSRAKFEVELARFEANPFPAKTFDCIGMFDVFEHLPRPEEFLGIARRRLNHGGLMLLAVPNTDTFDVKLMRHLKKLRHGDVFPTVRPLFHLFGYNRHNLGILFERNGFSCAGFETYRFEHYDPAARRSSRQPFNLNLLIGQMVASVSYLTRDDKLLIAFRRD